MKKAKKVLCVLLCTIIFFSQQVHAINLSNISNNIQEIPQSISLANIDIEDAELSIIKHELNTLNKVRVPIDSISEIDVAPDGKYEYVLPLGENINKIVITENNEDMVTIKITEGDLTNILTKTSDNKLFLDGHEVIYSDNEISDNNIGVDERGTIYKSQKSLTPFAPLSSYDTLLTKGTKNVKLGQTIDTIASGTFLTLISYLDFYVGLAVSTLSVIIMPIYNYLKGNEPKTTAVEAYYKTYIASYYDYQYKVTYSSSNSGLTVPTTAISYEHFTIY